MNFSKTSIKEGLESSEFDYLLDLFNDMKKKQETTEDKHLIAKASDNRSVQIRNYSEHSSCYYRLHNEEKIPIYSDRPNKLLAIESTEQPEQAKGKLTIFKPYLTIK